MYKILNQARGLKLIDFYNNNDFHIILSNYGASVYEIEMEDRNNKRELITLTPQYAFYYNTPKYAGLTVGRVCGRIEKGEFNIGSIKYHIDPNEKGNLNHSGKNTFAFKFFDFKIEDNDDLTLVTFFLNIKDMEDEFPGDLEFRVVYHLYKNKNKMRIEFQGISSKDTILNVCNHTYFNLSGGLKRNILDHELSINKGYVAKMNDDLLLKHIEVVSKEFDFRKPRDIGRYIYSDEVLFPAKGYDHLFTGSKPLELSLYDSVSGRYMEVKSTYKDVTIYTNNISDNTIYLGDVIDSPYLGIAIEPNRMGGIFTKDGIILKARTLYNYYTDYTFEVR